MQPTASLVFVVKTIFYILALAYLPGCAVVSTVDQPRCDQTNCKDTGPLVSTEGESAAFGWWQIALRYTWQENADPRWYLDGVAADQVFSPVLNEYRPEIKLWRFHRRAARDKSGHQFSWHFYSSVQTAKKIMEQVQASGMLRMLEDAGIVSETIYSDIHLNSKPDIKDTSDNSWSLELQAAWPYYIQGASEMWLELLRQCAAGMPPLEENASLEDKLDLYAHIQSKMDEVWRQEGNHAFLHHLNALFGYNALYVTERRLIPF